MEVTEAKPRVIEFKKGKDASTVLEETFEEFVDVVMRLRGVLDYQDSSGLKRAHDGACTSETPCTEVCEELATMNIANSLLNRLDQTMTKLNIRQ